MYFSFKNTLLGLMSCYSSVTFSLFKVIAFDIKVLREKHLMLKISQEGHECFIGNLEKVEINFFLELLT